MRTATPFAPRTRSRKAGLLAVVAGLMACMFAVQTLGFLFSSSGRAAFADGRLGVSLAMAGEICALKAKDEGKLPHRSSDHHHCAFCSQSDGDSAFDAALGSADITLLAHDPAKAPKSPLADAIISTPPGWGSSWSPRAPPIFS